MTQSSPLSADLRIERPGDLGSLIRGRRSVRKMRSDPVPAEVIESAIEAAGWAPSPHGRQPWRFVVVESDEARRRLAASLADSWRKQLTLDGQSDAVIEMRLGKSQERITDAPIVVAACLYLQDLDRYPDADRNEAERVMAIQSLGAAMQNFLLQIYAQGYDAGWMCAPLFAPETVRQALRLDEGLIPQALLPVGVAAADPTRRPRLPLAELITKWE